MSTVESDELGMLASIIDEGRAPVTKGSEPTPSPDAVDDYYEKLEQIARAHQSAEVRGAKMFFR